MRRYVEVANILVRGAVLYQWPLSTPQQQNNTMTEQTSDSRSCKFSLLLTYPAALDTMLCKYL